VFEKGRDLLTLNRLYVITLDSPTPAQFCSSEVILKYLGRESLSGMLIDMRKTIWCESKTYYGLLL